MSKRLKPKTYVFHIDREFEEPGPAISGLYERTKQVTGAEVEYAMQIEALRMELKLNWLKEQVRQKHDR